MEEVLEHKPEASSSMAIVDCDGSTTALKAKATNSNNKLNVFFIEIFKIAPNLENTRNDCMGRRLQKESFIRIYVRDECGESHSNKAIDSHFTNPIFQSLWLNGNSCRDGFPCCIFGKNYTATARPSPLRQFFDMLSIPA